MVAGVILLGVGANWLWIPKPADAAAYHYRIRAEEEKLPLDIGDWNGDETPIEPDAIKMLKPNALLSRRYTNAMGVSVGLLVVQCGNARDLVAHYPPVCRVNAGWTMITAEPHDWQVGDLFITGTKYRFEKHSLETYGSIVIDNFMILPDGRIARDMKPVDQAASDVRRRYFGAAQVQLVTSSEMSDEQRDACFITLLQSLRPMIQAIREGAQ